MCKKATPFNKEYSLLLILLLFIFNSCSVFQLNKRGIRKFDNEKYKKAGIAFEKALEKDPRNGEAYFGLARVKHAQKKYNDAIDFYNKSNLYGYSRAQKYRAASWYELAKQYYNQGLFNEGIMAVDNSLIDYRDLQQSKKLKPKLLVGSIEIDLKKGNGKTAWEKFSILKNNEIPFTNLVAKETDLLEPRVLLAYSEYNIRERNSDTALKSVQKVIENKEKLFSIYKKEAIEIRSRVYELKSDEYLSSEDYFESLRNIQKAILDNPINKSFIYKRGFVYEKIAHQNLTKGQLKDALKYVNLALEDSSLKRRTIVLKLRSEIFYALAVNEIDIDRKLEYLELALGDNLYDKKLKSYAYNLYMHITTLLLDEEEYTKALTILKKAILLNPTHRKLYSSYKENIDNTESIDFKMIVSEIYAKNLRFNEAVDILEDLKYLSLEKKPEIIYNLAKYKASSNDSIGAISNLRNFYTDNTLHDYYKLYREKSENDPHFTSIREGFEFYKWVEGINRVKLSLNNITNLPTQPGYIDPFLEISQKKRRLLTTPKEDDVLNIIWDDDMFHVVFDYDIDEPLYIKIIDSDTFADDLIFYKSFDNIYPDTHYLLFGEISNRTVLSIDVKDNSNSQEEYSTYTDLPPKLKIFKWLEKDIIRDGSLRDIYTIESPEIKLKYGNQYTVWNILGDLAPCFTNFFISKIQTGFISMQILYGLSDFFFNSEISIENITLGAFTEFMFKKVGLEGISSFIEFCECSYDAISKNLRGTPKKLKL